mmetsp:Transcript_19369/g.56658  ORF Transcript_19369/g.56658 Transcript_19369/m.56658 type:complete len:890 (-) Transcript_19369:350-3019(-)
MIRTMQIRMMRKMQQQQQQQQQKPQQQPIGASTPRMAGMPPPPARFAASPPGVTSATQQQQQQQQRAAGIGNAPGALYRQLQQQQQQRQQLQPQQRMQPHQVRAGVPAPQAQAALAQPPAAAPVMPWEERPFPMRLHWVVSHPEFRDVVAWLPGGRSWSILNRKAFEMRVMPIHFRSDTYASFIAQVNEWGFRRLTYGTGHESYHHEFFLRGVHHMVHKMTRPTRQAVRPQAAAPNAHVAPGYQRQVGVPVVHRPPPTAVGAMPATSGSAAAPQAAMAAARRSSGASAAIAGMLNLSAIPAKSAGPGLAGAAYSNSAVSTLSVPTASIAGRGAVAGATIGSMVSAQQQQQQLQQQPVALPSSAGLAQGGTPPPNAVGQKEVWELVCTLPKVGIKCMKSGCARVAVASWSSNLSPHKYWHTCEACQQRDFGGWPPEKAKVAAGAAGAASAGNSVGQAQPGSQSSPVSEDTYRTWLARKEKMWQHSCKDKNRGSGVAGDNVRVVSSESESSLSQTGLPWDSYRGGEKWQIVGSLNTCFGKKCMKAGCRRDAMSTWASDLRPEEKWYVCSDCEPRTSQLFPERVEAPKSSVNGVNKTGCVLGQAAAKHIAIVSSDEEEKRKIQVAAGGRLAQGALQPAKVTSSKASDEVNSMGTPNPTRNSALCILVRNRQWEKVRSLLGLRDPVEAWCGSDGRTALHEAVVMGAPTDVVKSIASAGPRMFTRDKLGYTPLDLAIRGFDIPHIADMVKTLLSYGPKPRMDAKDTKDNPLHQACKHDCTLEVIREIVRAYPEFVLEPDENGDTPVHLACSQRMLAAKVVAMIQHSPAACAMVNERGETPLHLACFLCDIETIQALVKIFPGALLAVDKRGCTAEKYMKSRKDLGEAQLGGCTN